jgi:hypothetical protein
MEDQKAGLELEEKVMPITRQHAGLVLESEEPVAGQPAGLVLEEGEKS